MIKKSGIHLMYAGLILLGKMVKIEKIRDYNLTSYL